MNQQRIAYHAACQTFSEIDLSTYAQPISLKTHLKLKKYRPIFINLVSFCSENSAVSSKFDSK